MHFVKKIEKQKKICNIGKNHFETLPERIKGDSLARKFVILSNLTAVYG
jgi:hypothetical protein